MHTNWFTRRAFIFWIQVFWLIVLVLWAKYSFLSPVPQALPTYYMGSVPLAVFWFGALGAVLISLTGIVEHARDWDESFALWHFSRPLIGASLAVVGVLILQAGVLATGATPTTSNATSIGITDTSGATDTTGGTDTAGATATTGATGTTGTTATTGTAGTIRSAAATTASTGTTGTATTSKTRSTTNKAGVATGTSGTAATGTNNSTAVPKDILYYIVAFLIGYREETFRELIKRLVDVILAPGTPPAKPKITGLNPGNVAHATGGQVVISGTGFTGATVVTVGSTTAAFKVDSDIQITAQAPAAAVAGPVNLTVKNNVGSATATFSYT